MQLNVQRALSLALPCAPFLVFALLPAATCHAAPIVYKCEGVNGKAEFTDVARPGCRPVDLPGYATPKPTTARRAPAAPPGRLTTGEAKRILERGLRDPESTRYRDVFVSATGDVCGMVNGKNGYGGYVGYTAFIVRADDRKALIAVDTPVQLFSLNRAQHCQSR
jgi:hypothetical protein